jgi:hypothetical protein
VLLPASLQNSHQNGGAVFLIFVADPIAVRLYPMSNTFSVPTQSSEPRPRWDSDGRYRRPLCADDAGAIKRTVR